MERYMDASRKQALWSVVRHLLGCDVMRRRLYPKVLPPRPSLFHGAFHWLPVNPRLLPIVFFFLSLFQTPRFLLTFSSSSSSARREKGPLLYSDTSLFLPRCFSSSLLQIQSKRLLYSHGLRIPPKLTDFGPLLPMFSWSHRKDSSRSEREGMEQQRRRRQQGNGRAPRLERRNAGKNIDYEASTSASVLAVAAVSWSSSSSDESPAIRSSQSLDLSPSPYSNQKSFRIGGSIEGEIDLLCRSLGLTGPEDFAIPVTAWEASKARSSSDVLPRSRLLHPDSPTPRDPLVAPNSTPVDPLDTSAEVSVGRRDDEVEASSQLGGPAAENKVLDDESPKISTPSPVVRGGDGGIKGVRPPVLAPPSAISPLSPPPGRPALALPPSMSIPAIDKGVWTWAASYEESSNFVAEGGRRSIFNLEEDEEEEEAPTSGEVAGEELRVGETFDEFTGTSSYATTNDDDTSSTTTETMFVISPNGMFKRRIRSWMRGGLLGRGSFGTVYEGISE